MTWVGSLGCAFGRYDLWRAAVSMRRLNLTSFVLVVSSSVCKMHMVARHVVRCCTRVV